MIFLKLLSKFIKVLRSGASPNQIAWGFALGTIPGLTPLACLHNLIVLLLIIIFKINLAAATMALALFSLIAWIFDPFFHSLGFYILVRISTLQGAWTNLYNAPIAPLSLFNNTVVMGSLAVALILVLPNYFWFKWFVRRYRETWNAKIDKWKIVKIMKGSKLVKVYTKIKGMEA
ncbi:TIGR03546 family protein [candidate division KSB1 bacterium]|nr:TIGR03546 family protein [candidate division KSB1 bacterium]